MEIKDLKAGDEVYVKHWSRFYSFWLKKNEISRGVMVRSGQIKEVD